MRKKLIFLISFLVAFIFFLVPSHVGAQTYQAGVDDSAQILGADVAQLTQQAQKVANQTKAGIFVVTTLSDTPENQFAKDYLAEKVGSGNNGAVLVINMNLRKVYIWTTGNLQYYMPSIRINSTLDVVQPALTSGTYSQGVSGFLDKLSEYFAAGIPTSRAYTIDPNSGKVTFHRSFQPLNILIAVLVSLIIAGTFIWTIYRRYQMKDAHAIWHYDYFSNSDLNLTQEQDLLINTFITTRRIPRPSNNSGGGGMSGGSGGGRSF
jgi:uncharacterized protein